jgi:hypothetical protein
MSLLGNISKAISFLPDRMQKRQSTLSPSCFAIAADNPLPERSRSQQKIQFSFP